jgi:hypothetical protein
MVAVRKLELVEVEVPAPAVREDPSQSVPMIEDALRTDEIDRARNMALLMAVLAVFALLWSPLLGGDPLLKLGANLACAYFAIVVRVRVAARTARRRLSPGVPLVRRQRGRDDRADPPRLRGVLADAAFRDACGNQLPPATREYAQVLIGELPWRA